MAEDDGRDDLLSEGLKAYERCFNAEKDNRLNAEEDIRFSRLSQQWPEEVEKQRKLDHRPCLTLNRLKAFIRQVVNDARQNKPSIKVHPVDSEADPKTAEIINGLIRNIEYISNADVAYDTAVEQSVSGGWGYWRIVRDYAYDDTFDMDLLIKRIANQFSVYGDPDSMEADSADWNVAFVVEPMRKEEFKRKYGKRKNLDGDAVNVDFSSDAWKDCGQWRTDETVMLAEWWRREETEREVVRLSNGHVYDVEALEKDDELQALIEGGVIEIVGKPRKVRSHKVTQVIMSGADVLEVNDWPGCYIPIVPIYGDEVIVDGKRHLFSLIHDAKDPQQNFNYWRTTAAELVGLSPRAPWVGPKGSFNSDGKNWNTANAKNHPYLEYDPVPGQPPPQRQPLDVGPAAGALQEALNASDDMKATIGMYDASLGARSNETSGRAILARQKEGDVATFHFIDNLSRAIRHTGRILIDLIPKTYTAKRIVRVIGEDGTPKQVKINSETPEPIRGPDGNPEVDEQGNAIAGIYDLTAGKYDFTVTTGPSYTTKREESAAQMMELVRVFPAAAGVIGDLLAKNLDWPGADEIAERLKSINPATQGEGIPPQVQQQIAMLTKQIEQLSAENQSLKADKSIDQFKAETDRIDVVGDQRVNEAKLALEASRQPLATGYGI